MRTARSGRIRSIAVASLMAIPLVGCGPDESARTFTMVGEEQEIRGIVTEATLTICGPAPDKPGTCEGTLVLEPQGKGEAGKFAVEVTRNVPLRKGGQAVFLPQLQGSQVIIKYRATKEGPKVATSVSAS